MVIMIIFTISVRRPELATLAPGGQDQGASIPGLGAGAGERANAPERAEIDFGRIQSDKVAGRAACLVAVVVVAPGDPVTRAPMHNSRRSLAAHAIESCNC